MRRLTSLTLLGLIGSSLLGCGGTAPPAAKGESQSPNASVDESNGAVIVSRTAPVPAAASSSERIIFLRAGSVWMMGPDGENPEQLTVRSLNAADESPRVSPDGQQLVYASAKDGQRKLYLQSMEDLIPAAITEGVDSQPAWSPDGSMLAFMRGDERVQRDLYVVRPGAEEGELPEPRRILEGDDDHPELAGAPVWSADGQSIILSADRREHRGTALWEVELESGALRRITPVRNGAAWTRDISPALSPAGDRIVFASNRHNSSGDDAGDFDIYSIALDGSGLTRLTDDPGIAAHPAYSADGSRLYFASTRIRESDFEWEIFVMAAGGGEQRRLTRDPRPQNYAPSVAVLPTEAD